MTKARWAASVMLIAATLVSSVVLARDNVDPKVTAKLLADLQAAEAEASAVAARMLGELFEPGKEGTRPAEDVDKVVEALAARLRSEIPGPQAWLVRRSCVEALGRIRTDACLAPLKEALDLNDVETAIAAAEVLRKILPAGDMKTLMLGKLTGGAAAARSASARYLEAAAAPDDIEALAAGLTADADPDDWRVRAHCAAALARIAKDARLPQSVCERLIALQADKVQNVVDASAAALTAAQEKSRDELVPVLVKATTLKGDPKDKADRTWQVRTTAMEVLGRIGMPHIKDHLAAVIAGLGDPALNVSRASQTALRGVPRELLYPTLLEQLKTTESKAVRAGILEMMSESPAGEHLRAAAEVAATVVKDTGGDDDTARLRAAAIGLLGTVKAAEAGPDIARGVVDDNPLVRQTALKALANLKIEDEKEQAAIAALLVPGIDDKDWRKAAAAAEALAGFPGSDAVKPLIQTGLAHSVVNVQEAAANTLIRYGKDEALRKQVEQVLLEETKVNDKVWEYGAKVFGALGTKAAAPLVVHMIHQAPADKESHWRVQMNAAEALGLIGERDAAVRTALKICAQSPVMQVQNAASNALRLLGPDE